MSPKRKKTGTRKKTVGIFRTGKVKARLLCGKFLEDGITPCPLPFKTEKGRKQHHDEKHSTPERMQEVKQRRIISMYKTQSLTSIARYFTFRHKLGIPLEEDDMADLVQTMGMININSNKKNGAFPEPYHGCFMLVMEKEWVEKYIAVYPDQSDPKEPDPSYPDPFKIIDEFWMEIGFKLKVFIDSSKSPGPCAYHGDPRIGRYSGVADLIKQDWVVFTNNITFDSGDTSLDNKNSALHFQLVWKWAAFIRGMRTQDPTVAKLEYLNKNISSKGCTKPMKTKHFRQALEYAFQDHVPDDIRGSSKPFEIYNIKEMIEQNDALNPILDPDMENFAASDDCSKLNLTFEQAQQIMSELHINISNFTPYPLTLVLPTTTIAAAALLNLGPAMVPPVVNYIRKLFPKFNTSNRRVGAIVSQPDIWFCGTGSRQKRVYDVEPGKKQELLKKLQKWGAKYGDEIEKHMANPELLQRFIIGELGKTLPISSASTSSTSAVAIDDSGVGGELEEEEEEEDDGNGEVVGCEEVDSIAVRKSPRKRSKVSYAETDEDDFDE